MYSYLHSNYFTSPRGWIAFVSITCLAYQVFRESQISSNEEFICKTCEVHLYILLNCSISSLGNKPKTNHICELFLHSIVEYIHDMTVYLNKMQKHMQVEQNIYRNESSSVLVNIINLEFELMISTQIRGMWKICVEIMSSNSRLKICIGLFIIKSVKK